MLHNFYKRIPARCIFLFLAGIALLITTDAMAIPARRQWVRLQVGSQQVDAMLVGDENMHYFITRDGRYLAPANDGTWHYESGKNIRRAEKRTRQISPLKAGRKTPKLSGKKVAPVILVNFHDKKFASDSAAINLFYQNMLNLKGYNENGAVGSVSDYFSDMSRGQFDLTFDIFGPVTANQSATYYGGPSYYFGGTDHAGEFIDDVIHKADSLYDIDWTRYDWNNDGEVEQVFVLYAGYGMATGGPTGTIWPHAWTLDEAHDAEAGGRGGFSLDGVFINRYACGNELNGSTGQQKMGMGVFCHEFSHCLGLPDMYDTKYSSRVTMEDFDLLDHGSYNGPNGIGWVPAGWTSYERAYAGWMDLTELQPGDQITGMKPLTDNDANAYVIYNDGNRNEYYLLENRQRKGWDSYIPEEGLLAIHVDYDSTLFANNIVNSVGDFTREEGYDGNFHNDHPRVVPLYKIRSIENETYYMTYPMVNSSGRLLTDSITDTSRPAAELYNDNTDSSKLLHKPVYDIKSNNGLISFNYMPEATPAGIEDIDTEEEGKANRIQHIYSLSGEYLGTNLSSLAHGVYIIQQETLTRKIIK